MKESPKTRDDFCHFLAMTTRWADNDVYGHVNNVVYYQWFDTVVNEFLIKNDTLDTQNGEAIGLVVETHCNYFSSIAFPDRIVAGLRVTQLGKSSVRYEVGIFRDDDHAVSAQGHFVHVYVDRITRKPTPIPVKARTLLESLQVESTHGDSK